MKCDLDFAHPVIPKVDSISYHRYHNINIFCHVSCYHGYYDRYISGLGGVLDRHAPLICQRTKKIPAGWLSDSNCRAKSITHQFECVWHRDKSQLSRNRLCRQTALYTIRNRDNAYY